MTRMRCGQRSGTVVFVVVVLVLLMSVAAYHYLIAMETENLAAQLNGDQLIARQAALSACDLVAILLEYPRTQRQSLGGLNDNPKFFAVLPVDDTVTPDDESVPRSYVVSPNATVAPATEPMRYGATNESSKLHLQRLVEWDRRDPEFIRAALMRLPRMEEATADALLDWIDADSQPRLQGAEADTYAAQTLPQTPRNQVPLDMEELLLIPGISAVKLFGLPRGSPSRLAITTPGMPNRNVAPEPFAPPWTAPPWIDYLTIYSAERNETRNGEPRIFVNDRRLDRLHQRLVQAMPVEWANFIVLYRQFGPAEAKTETISASEVTVDLTRMPRHPLKSPLDLIGVMVNVKDGNTSTDVQSPFLSDPLTMQAQLPQLVDQITVVPERRLVGRVNINLARREVLLGIPGVDEGLADRILAARTIGGDGVQGRDHDVWLLTEGIVAVAEMRGLLPNITVGGDVYRGQFWGYVDDRAPSFGFEAVLDASDGIARQVYYRELSADKLPRRDNIVAEFAKTQ